VEIQGPNTLRSRQVSTCCTCIKRLMLILIIGLIDTLDSGILLYYDVYELKDLLF
jgi:hypothetical protein